MKKISQFLTHQAVKYLVNQQNKYFNKKIQEIKPYNIDDFNGLKTPKVIYLAGGMDNTPDGGVGWRQFVEEIFEYDGRKRIVKDKDIFDLSEGKNIQKILNKYAKPVILNPVRNEVDRSSDEDFFRTIKEFKSGVYNKKGHENDLKLLASKFNNKINVMDLNLVLIADSVFFGFDGTAGAGTYGELQTLSYLNRDLYVWFNNDKSFKNLSPWTLPQLTKICQTDEEAKRLITNFIDMNMEENIKYPIEYVGCDVNSMKYVNPIVPQEIKQKINV